MTYAAKCQIHLCQSICGRFLLLTVYVNTTDIALLCFYQIRALNKHTTRAAAGIIQCPVKWLNNGSYQLYDIVRSIKLAFLLSGIYGKLFQKVLLYASDQILLFTKSLVTDLVDLVYNLLHVVGSQIALGESTFNKAAL